MSRILPRVVLMACVALVSSSALAKSLEEIASPEQLLELLGQARSVRVEGRTPPDDPKTGAPAVQYPIVLSNAAEIRRLADFFRRAELLLDETSTRLFREDAKIGTDLASRITIDGKFSVLILSSDMVMFADSLTYRGPETPGPLWSNFHTDFALLLAKIARPSREPNGSRHR